MRIFPVIVILFLTCGCRGKLYRAPSYGMEATIRMGEHFYVKETDEFNRNDIAVYDYYGPDYTVPDRETGTFPDRWMKYIHRIIALSGDTLLIKDGDVYINGRITARPEGAVDEYELTSSSAIIDFPERNVYTSPTQTGNFSLQYFVQLTKEEMETYKQRKEVLSIRERIVEYDAQDSFMVRPFDGCQWTIDNFGPLVIPSPGEELNIDRWNHKLYKNIPGASPGKLKLEERLYFVMGDNRHASQDSRFIGFIPHSHMYGIVK